jgi:hypothetical protein
VRTIIGDTAQKAENIYESTAVLLAGGRLARSVIGIHLTAWMAKLGGSYDS